MSLKFSSSNKRTKEAYAANKCSYASLALEQICRRLKEQANPRILDLGQPNEQKVSYYSTLSKKIYFEDLCSQSALLNDNPEQRKELFEEQFHISASGSFDLIMAWDLFNYLLPHELTRLSELLDPLIKDGTKLYALLWTKNPISKRPLIFKPSLEHNVIFDYATPEEQSIAPLRKSTLAKQITNLRRSSSTLLKNGFEEYLLIPRKLAADAVTHEVIKAQASTQIEQNLGERDTPAPMLEAS